MTSGNIKAYVHEISGDRDNASHRHTENGNSLGEHVDSESAAKRMIRSVPAPISTPRGKAPSTSRKRSIHPATVARHLNGHQLLKVKTAVDSRRRESVMPLLQRRPDHKGPVPA